ncbi:MAG TPA: glycosyltransferase family 9 protein [Bdellovibrionales bacterium]|nr:glycosyltransferase family 9 protein [Bdellovibrionales bacterium]
MKILVISLLRLGDVIMAAPAIASLKAGRPNARVHLLVNSQFRAAASMIEGVDKVIGLDREQLQRGLGEADRSVFESFDRLQELIADLRREGYSRVINLTHNRFSGWIASLIGVEQTDGLAFTPQGRSTFGSAWFRYLNAQMSVTDSEPFHYIDLFRFATAGVSERPAFHLIESVEGQKQASTLVERGRDLILLQPLTSDQKKNWGLDRYAAALKTLAAIHPHVRFGILGAPAERSELEPFVTGLSEAGVPARLLVCDLQTAFSLLKRARLLITGDTSIKHLAAAAGTRIVEISVGSSDFRKTGAYSPDNVIIQSKEPCAPCPHRGPCSRESHACAESLSPELVGLAASKAYLGHFGELRLIAREFEDQADLYQTGFTESGYWTYHSLRPRDSERALARLIDLASWKLYVYRDQLGPVGEYGTEGVWLGRALKSAYPEQPAEEWTDQASILETQLERLESRLAVFLVDLREYLKRYNDDRLMRQFQERVRSYFVRQAGEPVLISYQVEILSVLDEVEALTGNDFLKIRKLSDGLMQAHQRVEVELKLLRSTKTNVMEHL